MAMDLNKLMKQAPEMQEQMAKAQEELRNETVEASAGGVRILTSLSEKTVNGTDFAFSVAPVVPARYVPVTATRVPTAPLAGVKPLIVGGRWKLIRRMLPVPRSR